MEERQVTIDGTTYPMGEIYTILATQNPIEQEGTYKLPDAQLDRFLMKITLDYPSLEEEVEILERHNGNIRLAKLEEVKPVITAVELLKFRELVSKVYLEPSLLRHIATIVHQTRPDKRLFFAVSPRSTIASLQLAHAYAPLH